MTVDIAKLRALHSDAPAVITTHLEGRPYAQDSAPDIECRTFYEAAHLELPELLSEVERLRARSQPMTPNIAESIRLLRLLRDGDSMRSVSIRQGQAITEVTDELERLYDRDALKSQLDHLVANAGDDSCA